VKRLALLLPLALVAGCGGSTTAASGGASKADFVRQAEAICAKANADQKALKTPTELHALAPYVAKVVAIADTATTGLLALEAPRADKAELEAKVLGPLKGQLITGHDYADKVAAASKSSDQKALITLLGSPPTETKADLPWMKDYGFTECVKAADTSS
jgi:hypothetical protein